MLNSEIPSHNFGILAMAETTGPHSVSSDEEQWLGAYRRIRAMRSRPTTQAALDFWKINRQSDELFTATLPKRLERLCHVLQDENWTLLTSTDTSDGLSQDAGETKRLALTAAVMVRAPRSFRASFRKLMSQSLASRRSLLEQHQDSLDRQNNTVTPMDTDKDESLFRSLQTLGWLRVRKGGGELVEPLGQAIHKTILEHTRRTIAGEFEQGDLFESVQTWQENVVNTWVCDLVGNEAYVEDEWSQRLALTAAECFCVVRVDEMFDIVAEYPDSHATVMELRDVLHQTRMYSHLGDIMRNSLTKRLIHPGANTSQIIDVYISTIKVLREIDPSDRLLDVVTGPVRSYLRERKDTVRCIISSLTDEEAAGDLYEELRRHDARPLENAQVDSDDEEEPPDLNWMPPPPLSRQHNSFVMGGTSRGTGGDILSMLVSIYGSKELFVNEYRLMLADKLLANLDYDTDKEVHTLELLKLRFGELSMRQCEIMIKDTDDSKRIISNIHSTINGLRLEGSRHDPVVDAAIVSHIYWPTLQKENLKHHPSIQNELDKFADGYGRLKNPRRLVWFSQLGTVQLELDVLEENLDGKPLMATREFTCSPLLATLISYFEDNDHWSSEDLANEVGIAEHIVQKKMSYWVSKRVIVILPNDETPSRLYQLATREHFLQVDSGPESIAHSMTDDEGNENQAVSVGAQDEEEMDTYESYVVGMLKNMGQLPLDRIHNMLKMFVTSGTDHKYNKTPQQLSSFLQSLCRQEKLECGPDGMYKLFKR